MVLLVPMLFVQMLHQVSLLFEYGLANVAPERRIGEVAFLVPSQIVPRSETLATFVARVSPHIRMGCLVQLQLGTGVKRSRTNRTPEVSVGLVGSPVHMEGRLLLERTSAHVATIWFLVGVQKTMFLQVTTVSEPFATDFTRIVANLLVNFPHVPGQSLGNSECLFTVRACKRSFAAVDSQMGLIRIGRHHLLPTVGTSVGNLSIRDYFSLFNEFLRKRNWMSSKQCRWLHE